MDQASLQPMLPSAMTDNCTKPTTPSGALVTVMIAAHNRRVMLEEAIASCLAQDWTPLRVLVVDDGSDPEIALWLDDWAEEEARLHVIHQPRRGVAAARARGLLAAEDGWICILDSDDRLARGAVRKIMQRLLAPDRPDVIYTGNRHFLPDGSERVVSYPRYPDNASMLSAVLTRPIIPFKHSGTVASRRTFLIAGGYDPRLRIKVDIDLFVRFLVRGWRLELMPEPLVWFRMHGKSMSRRRLRGIVAWWKIVDRHVEGSIMFHWKVKVMRAAAEFAKAGYALICLR